MKKTIFALFLAVAAFPAAAQDFGKLFEDFAREAKEEHTRFRDEADRTFADFLNESWTEFRVFAGKEYPRKPKPKTAPVAPSAPVEIPGIQPVPEPPAIPDVPDSGNLPETVEEPAPVPGESQEAGKPQEVEEPVKPGLRACVFDYYGRAVRILVPDAISDYRMAGNSEKEVARFWDALSKADYAPVIGQIEGYASEMRLGEWALCLLVENFSKTIFGPQRKDEMEVFRTFVLNQMGIDARMGLADGRLETMVSIKEQVYSRLFCEFEGRTYYLDPDVQDVKRFLSYSAKFSDSLSPVSVGISRPMHLGGAENVSLVRKSSNVFGASLVLPVNSSQCSFYLDYPQADVDVYARAAYDDAFVSALCNALRPFVSGKDELSQVNMLLKFLQYDFDYSTDDDQFGYEKPFFLEENFIYPANDCEDRSILFSFLVRNVLGLDVVLLDYPDHIATAVCFNTDVPGDSFLYKGRRFTICDPTYIGAPAGMAMDDYRDAGFKVLAL